MIITELIITTMAAKEKKKEKIGDHAGVQL